jgi:glycosyltransferase involved in cell wall biosynthesis
VPEAALDLARAALQKEESPGILRGVARVLYACGDYTAAADAVTRLERLSGELVGKDEEFAREVRGRTRLLSLLAEPVSTVQQPAVPGRSVYFLHFSLPYTSVGYATRSHGLIAGIQAAGYDVRPYTRPGFPHDFKPELEAATLPDVDRVDGIDYHRLLVGSRRGNSESEYLLSSVEAYERVLRAERPDVVHAASNYVTALPALLAARRLGLPFIYEIRGFWEITRSSRDNEFENSARFAMMRHFEGLVARSADHVFTLTSAMKAELITRGVRAERISLVHNGVDPQRFLPAQPNRDLASRLGLSANVPVIGYVGSFVDYEGLDDLVRACGMLSRRDIDFRLLLVGDGAVMNDLQEIVRDERLEQRAILTGRVPHHEVNAYYSLVDICPFPRKPWEVCEMVSPLKPFEAMAMQKAVLVSSTHALSEIVVDGQNGLVFQKGSVDSLADCLERMVTDHSLRQRLERQGRTWVLEHRTWQAAGRVVVDGYRDVLAASKRLDNSRVPA